MPNIHDLIRKLTAEVRDERQEAAWELGNLGPAAAPAAEALVEALADESIRKTAEWALARIGPPAVGALATALSSPDRSVRIAAVKALRNVAAGSGVLAAEALARALGDAEPEIRALAARELGEIGPTAMCVTEVLVRALGDVKPEVREASARALGRVAEVELPVIERLTSHLSDGDLEVRQSSVGALVTMAQRKRTRDFLLAVSRLEQLARKGPAKERALYRTAAEVVRVSVPARRSWPFPTSNEASLYETLPRPAEAPVIDTESLPRVDGED